MALNLKERFLNWKPVQKTLQLASEIRPPGFEGMSVYDVARYFIEGLQKGAVSTRAAAIAFRFFLSVFPAIIVLLSLIPYIPIENFQEELFLHIRGFFPGDTFSLFESTLDDLINRTHGTVLSIGFVLALFFASDTVNAVLIGFNGSYNLEKKRNPLVLRLLSLVILLALVVNMVIAIGIITFNEFLFDHIRSLDLVSEGLVIFGIHVAEWLVILLLIYSTVTMLYNVGDFNRSKWKLFSAGASFATVFFIIASLGFAWFVQNFAQYNKLYGSLGTFIVLLIWMNFNCNILLLGFELNTSISRAKLIFKNQNTTSI